MKHRPFYNVTFPKISFKLGTTPLSRAFNDPEFVFHYLASFRVFNMPCARIDPYLDENYIQHFTCLLPIMLCNQESIHTAHMFHLQLE
jgi:hypothetical protein